MSTLELSDSTLTVRFTTAEKVLGLLRDQVVPRSAVAGAEVVPTGLSAVRGVRAPGLAVPGRRLGTWRGRGVKRLVDVRRGQPALRVVLRDQPYDELLLGTDRAEELATRLRVTP